MSDGPAVGAFASRARTRLGAGSWLDLALPVVFLVLLAFAAVASETFLTQTNISNLLRQIVTNGLLSPDAPFRGHLRA
ncbi:hypothetical protein BH23CHL8_BH23CHL8_22350 [soil metagenome]